MLIVELGIEFKKIKLGKKYFYGSAQKSLVFSHTHTNKSLVAPMEVVVRLARELISICLELPLPSSVFFFLNDD